MTDSLLDLLDGETTSDYWSAKDNPDRLHLVRPIRFDETAWDGDGAMIADVVVLDEDGDEHKTYPAAKVSGKAVINQLQQTLDNPKATYKIGRISKVQPKQGKNPYWQFSDATEADKAVAIKYLSAAAPF